MVRDVLNNAFYSQVEQLVIENRIPGRTLGSKRVTRKRGQCSIQADSSRPNAPQGDRGATPQANGSRTSVVTD
jgi:hypothetical protein